MERAKICDVVRIVAVEGEAIGGHLFGECTDEGMLHTACFYVAKGFRRQGIGRKLLTQAIDEAGEAKPLKLGVFEENLEAIGFYKAHGFVVIGADNTLD